MGARQRTRAWGGDRAWSGRCGLRGLGEGDGEAERFDLPDVVFDLLVFVGAGLVVAGAEVGEPVGGVGGPVPGDDQDGAGDCDLGLGLAAAAGDAVVPLAEEGLGAGGDVGGLAEGAAQPGVTLTFLPVRVRGPDWRAEGHSPAQDTRWAAVGNRDMSRPISAMMARARSGLMPGISASRATAGSTAASGPAPAFGPVVPSPFTPQAAGIAAASPAAPADSALIRSSTQPIWSSSRPASPP